MFPDNFKWHLVNFSALLFQYFTFRIIIRIGFQQISNKQASQFLAFFMFSFQDAITLLKTLICVPIYRKTSNKWPGHLFNSTTSKVGNNVVIYVIFNEETFF